MNRIFNFTLLTFSFSIFLAACGGAANNSTMNVNHSAANNTAVVTNANSMMNGSSSMTNSNMSNMSGNTSGASGFINDAAMGGMTEVELGKMASQKAQNADVKKFGQMMVEDHSNANTELKALASKKGVTLPTELDGKHKSLRDRLQGLSGADFDKAYVEAMVDDHEEDVEKFKNQSEDNSDPDVKAFAAKTLPVLQKHLQAIKDIQSKMK